MENPGLSQWLTEVHGAVDELAKLHPETWPAILDGPDGTVRLASGETIALGPLLAELAGCPLELAPGRALTYLLEAKAAARSLTQLEVGSWPDMSPRLGLALRRSRRELIGPPIGSELTLAAMVDAGQSLIPVTDELRRRWSQTVSCVISVATANTIDQPIDCQEFSPRPSTRSGPHTPTTSAMWVALGGPFTTGRLVDLDSIATPIGAEGALVTCLGDRALLVAPMAGGAASDRHFVLAHALQNLAADLRRRMSIRPGYGLDAILRCRSNGQVSIFRTRGDGE